MTEVKEVGLSATERLSTILAVLGVGHEDMIFVEKEPIELVDRFYIPPHAGEFIPSEAHILVSCADEYIGVLDAHNLPDILPRCENEATLAFGKCPEDLRELNSLLKEKLAIYTIYYGFCEDNPHFKIKGFCFFINYMFYIDGKSTIVTIYQASPAPANAEE